MTNRQRTDDWNWFITRTNSRTGTCRLCRRNMNITNIRSHVQKTHTAIYVEFVSRQQRIANRVQNRNEPTPSTSAEQQLRVRHKRLANQVSSNKKKLIDRDLLNFFVKDLQPSSIVENVGFAKLMKWIPGYNLPNRETISSVMLPTLYTQRLQTVKSMVLQNVESLCITTDCFTSSVDNGSHMVITGYYISKEFIFKSIVLKCLPFSTIHFEEDIKTLLTDWNLRDKVNFSVSDNEEIGNIFKNKLKLRYYDCYAYTLNAIIHTSLGEVQPTLEKIREIVGHFKKNPLAGEKLLRHQLLFDTEQKYLIDEVANRWNSTFYMLRRFVELEGSIRAIAPTYNDLPVMTDAEWQFCKHLCEILTPFEVMTKGASLQKYMTGSSLIVMTTLLKCSCERLEQNRDYSNEAKNILAALKCGLEIRFRRIEESSTLAMCTLLDPRYKQHVFRNKPALIDAKRRLQELVVGLIENKSQRGPQHFSQPSTSAAFKNAKAREEIEKYLQHDMLSNQNKNGENNCPLDWWRNHQYAYPNLAELFRIKCNIVATTIPCEMLFSSSGDLVSDRRTQLASKDTEMIMFLNGNE